MVCPLVEIIHIAASSLFNRTFFREHVVLPVSEKQLVNSMFLSRADEHRSFKKKHYCEKHAPKFSKNLLSKTKISGTANGLKLTGTY